MKKLIKLPRQQAYKKDYQPINHQLFEICFLFIICSKLTDKMQKYH